MKSQRLLLGILLVASLLLIRAERAHADALSLQNGWTAAPFGTSPPEAFVSDGIIYLKGAMASGTSNPAFVLPPAMWPSSPVYTHVDLFGANPGRLFIDTNGEVSVYDANFGIANASAFVSLDGAKFGREIVGFTALALLNGWTETSSGFNFAFARLVDGIVHLKGEFSGGTAGTLFTLPPTMRPETDVYVRISLCVGRKGRLHITPSGSVTVESLGPFSDAQCFTSLEGASFAVAAVDFTGLALENGWTNAPFSTSAAAASMADDGVVRFKGAVAGGLFTTLFTLPPEMRPETEVYVPVDLCGSKPGRLHVFTDGHVTVEFPSAETFAGSAQCFTSLDGASFIPSRSGFQVLRPLNGWVNGVYGTQTASAALYGGIVHFKGALTDGTSNTLFTLPVGLRPDRTVYVLVDLCSANTGSLAIEPDGSVSVFSATTFAAAQCFTSLEGASFTPSGAGPAEWLAFYDDWWLPGIAPLIGGIPPKAQIVDGMVQLKGAVGSGSTPLALRVPIGANPATDLFLPVRLASSQKGRLWIDPNGDVSIFALGSFSDAQAYTSLDGVKFAPATNRSFAPLTPLNGWTPSIYTGPPAATIVRDIVYLKGSISTTGTNARAFLLPPVLRPEGMVYVPVDLCFGNKGRLVIHPTGEVDVEELGTGYSNAQCFTSLDGASYAVPEPALVPALVSGVLLLGGWVGSRGRSSPAGSRATS